MVEVKIEDRALSLSESTKRGGGDDNGKVGVRPAAPIGASMVGKEKTGLSAESPLSLLLLFASAAGEVGEGSLMVGGGGAPEPDKRGFSVSATSTGSASSRDFLDLDLMGELHTLGDCGLCLPLLGEWRGLTSLNPLESLGDFLGRRFIATARPPPHFPFLKK